MVKLYYFTVTEITIISVNISALPAYDAYITFVLQIYSIITLVRRVLIIPNRGCRGVQKAAKKINTAGIGFGFDVLFVSGSGRFSQPFEKQRCHPDRRRLG